jgi:hypothetical protein
VIEVMGEENLEYQPLVKEAFEGLKKQLVTLNIQN